MFYFSDVKKWEPKNLIVCQENEKIKPCEEIVIDSNQEYDIRITQESSVEKTQESDIDKSSIDIMEDKWKQLLSIYPTVSPFFEQQEDKSISLTPKDFVILSNPYQKLVSNSFLLHGFYNYRHVILLRENKDEKVVYYIGVPGNYYKREKMVAEMFGFETFRATIKQDEEALRPGVYGYYLTRVEI